jgi:hypothetical protein
MLHLNTMSVPFSPSLKLINDKLSTQYEPHVLIELEISDTIRDQLGYKSNRQS